MTQQWSLAGDYFEACNFESICPCIFLADPDEGDCQLALAWRLALAEASYREVIELYRGPFLGGDLYAAGTEHQVTVSAMPAAHLCA